jgi:hypothetical protein
MVVPVATSGSEGALIGRSSGLGCERERTSGSGAGALCDTACAEPADTERDIARPMSCEAGLA